MSFFTISPKFSTNEDKWGFFCLFLNCYQINIYLVKTISIIFTEFHHRKVLGTVFSALQILTNSVLIMV